MLQPAKCQLSYYERVRPDLPICEQQLQLTVDLAQMVDPDGAVDEDHLARRRGPVARRRRGTTALGSVPPKAASLLALSRAIKARSPACTMAVFSSRPDRRRAFSSSSASRMSVVRICKYMHQRITPVKRQTPHRIDI